MGSWIPGTIPSIPRVFLHLRDDYKYRCRVYQRYSRAYQEKRARFNRKIVTERSNILSHSNIESDGVKSTMKSRKKGDNKFVSIVGLQQYQ
jgi:hypothetical protein